MNKYDFIILKRDVKELAEKNIFAGSMGILTERKPDSNEWLAIMMNAKNHGEYAVALVHEDDVDAPYAMPHELREKMEKLMKERDFFEHTAFSVSKIKEYDHVELIVDRPEYEKAGVKKGMDGCVMSDYAILGRWQVVFSEDGTGEDIADIEVLEEDLRVID